MRGSKVGGGERAFAAAAGSRYWGEQDARVVLEEWSSSGLELEEFARRHSLKARRLRRWSERLGPQARGVFHPVELKLDGLALRQTADAQGGVTVVVRGGRRVAVERDFDEGLLARVVRVLESWSC